MDLSNGELWERMRFNLEALVQTWMGTKVALDDVQVLEALAAMGARERHTVLLRCAGVTVEEIAERNGYSPVQIHVLTIAGLEQAMSCLWPGGPPRRG